MWPQKWKPSAACARRAPATIPPPVAARSIRPIRARKPRLELAPTTVSLSRPSGMPLGRGQQALELDEGVERALREHRPLGVQDDPVGAARDPERAPRGG